MVGAKPVVFHKDDLVLRWEPSLQKESVEEKSVAGIPIPGKWKDCWSGPHLVIGLEKARGSHPDGNKYLIRLAESGLTVSVHVNVMHLFTPWSDSILSSSGATDDPRGWSDRGQVPVGSLFAVALGGRFDFGIGKVSRIISAADGKGDYLQYQWYGNRANNIKSQPVLPGWTRPDGSGCYYASDARATGDRAYTGATSGTPVRDRDILLHSFHLTKGQRIPAAIYRSISAASDSVRNKQPTGSAPPHATPYHAPCHTPVLRAGPLGP